MDGIEKLREKIVQIIRSTPIGTDTVEALGEVIRRGLACKGFRSWEEVAIRAENRAADAILSLLEEIAFLGGNSSAQSQPGCAPKSATSGSEPSGSEIARLREVLLNRIRSENDCRPDLEHRPDCTGWDAEKCGCALEARALAALSTQAPSPPEGETWEGVGS